MLTGYILIFIFLPQCFTSNIENHPAWKIIDATECGDSVADRIIGGQNASLGQFPWIARLGYEEYGEIDYKCAGVLITDRHVVTAGHCVNSNTNEPVLSSIRLGEYNAITNPDCQDGVCAPKVQDYQIKRLTIHQFFNEPKFHNDVAIIELEKPAILNDYIAPICLPRQDEQLADLLVGDRVLVAGWGKTNMSTAERADILQVLSIPVVESELCDSLGEELKVTKSRICAGAETNKDACVGDSGGPLMKVFDTPEGPKCFLVGVVSFGPIMCGIKKPGVYTSVAYYLMWILDHIII